MKIDPNELQALSKLVDQWLDLPPESRQAWLESLGPEHADLPALLQQFGGDATGPFLGTLPKLTTHADSAAGEPSALSPGELVGPYRLVRELGRGGMSVVWLAERADGALKRDVALKLPFVSQQTVTLAARFARERDILAALEHPNIARLYDAGVGANGQPYLALEFVEGEPIVGYCDRLRLGIAQRLALFLEVLRTVQYAHTRLVVHRDLKPSNILVTRGAQIRLLDFGIAKLLTDDQTGLTELTRVGNQPLTPGYASPEQIAGDIVTTASDVYSLGVLLYELLAGERPYRLKHNTRRELETAILEADVLPPSQAAGAGALRGDLDTIALKALQKQPLMRYASADAFAQDIQRYLRGEAVLAKPHNAWYHLRKFARRNRIAVVATAAVITALSIGLGVAVSEKRRAQTEAATSKALSDFLQNDLLAQASARKQSTPNTRPNPDLKVRDALDRASAAIAGRFDSQPPVEASIRETIGATYKDLGLYAESMPHIERAFALRKRVLGPAHPDTLRSMGELGILYVYAGKYALADTMLTEAYTTRRRLLGKDHPDTLAAMNDLLILSTRQGNYERSAVMLAEVLDVQQRVLGEQNANTIVIIHNLATAYVNLNRFAKAEELYVRALDLKRRSFGPEHPSTLATLNSLGTVYRSEGNYQQAGQALTQALEIRRRVLGDRHPDTLDSMSSLGLLYEAQCNYDQAEPLLTQVLETRREVLGPDHSTTLASINNLAELYRRQGKLAQSESLFSQLVDTRRRVLGPDHPGTLQALTSLGGIKLADRRYKDAESLLQSACNGFEKIHADSWQRYYAQSLLGAALSGQGKDAEAAPLLTSGHAGLVQRQDSIPADTRSIILPTK